MSEFNQSMVSSDGLRKFKKVKRPIKRFVPGNPVSPTVPHPEEDRSEHKTEPLNSQSNLDELLDNQLNLPSVNATTQQTFQPLRQPAPRPQAYSQDGGYQQPERFLSEDDFAPKPRFIDTLMEGNLFTIKGVALVAVLVLILGVVLTKLVVGGKTVVKDGLQGVVVNAEVPRGRARCGVAERTQGCVLYIMNPQRRDLQGRDFYDLASQLTGRQRFVVETGNMRYSSVKIRPGDIAQINIPPLQ